MGTFDHSSNYFETAITTPLTKVQKIVLTIMVSFDTIILYERVRSFLGQPIRPSRKELSNRLKEAAELLSRAEGLFVEPGKAAAELNALKLDNSEEVWTLIRSLLREISLFRWSPSSKVLREVDRRARVICVQLE